MNEVNTVDKVINAKFIFSSTLKSIIVRNKRTNHQAIVVPAAADQNELVHTEVDPLSKGSERLSA